MQTIITSASYLLNNDHPVQKQLNHQRQILDVQDHLIPCLVHRKVSPELLHDTLEIHNRYHQLIMKLLPIPTLIQNLEICFFIIMITNHPPQRTYHHQHQRIQEVEVDLDHYLIIEIDIEIMIITHPHNINLNH